MSSTSTGGAPISLFANQIIKFIVLLVGCAFSVLIAVQITSTGGNALATLAQYAAGATFIAALISPRTGVYLVLFMCPVLDFIKRGLIFFDSLNMLDVATVLAAAPLTLAGAMVGMFFNRFIFRRQMPIEGENKLYLILALTVALTAATDLLHNADSQLMLLRSLGETCIYLGLMVLIPVYFRTTEEIATLLRWCVVIFVPVALYGFWQKAFGLSDFEYRYLMSGLTSTADDFTANERVFSTLNSNHSFSVTMASCAVLCLLQKRLPVTGSWQRFVSNHARWFFVLFCLATFISFRRTGWLIVVFACLGAYCFRSRFRTGLFYGFCVVGTALIIINTEFIFRNLPVWEGQLQTAIPGYDQAFYLQTFNDRLWSFENLRDNPAIWSAFGLTAEEKGSIYTHDAISQTLVSYGVVGMFAFIAVLVGVLVISHRLIWNVRDKADRLYLSLLVAFIFSHLFIGGIMQTHITIYPINFIFWMCVGVLLKIITSQQPSITTDQTLGAPKAVRRQIVWQ